LNTASLINFFGKVFIKINWCGLSIVSDASDEKFKRKMIVPLKRAEDWLLQWTVTLNVIAAAI